MRISRRRLTRFLAVPFLTLYLFRFSANDVGELTRGLPSHIDSTILVNTTTTTQNWEKMFDAQDGLPCSVVWHNGQLFITELRSYGHGTAVASFAVAMIPLLVAK